MKMRGGRRKMCRVAIFQRIRSIRKCLVRNFEQAEQKETENQPAESRSKGNHKGKKVPRNFKKKAALTAQPTNLDRFCSRPT